MQRAIQSESDAETSEKTVVQTVKLSLETSDSKTDKVRRGVAEFQRIARHFGDLMPSIPEYERTRNNEAFYNLIKKKFDDTLLNKQVAANAAYHAIEVWDSYTARGAAGDRPTLGEGSYIQLTSQNFEIADNGDGNYGIKTSFIPYKPEWFGISATPYTREYLERVFDEEDAAETGSCELRVDDDGQVTAHLVVKWPVEVYEPDDVATTVGVKIGETVIYSAVAVTDETVLDVELQSGSEFRHHREQLKQKRKQMMEKGDLRGIKQCRNDHERYTEQVLDTASRRIIEMAVAHEPAVIALEDLTYLRETVDAPIHDWPYAKLQNKITYKAKAEGIPVQMVNPQHTAITCRKCGEVDATFRDGADFACGECGYEVHSYVNGAINLTQQSDNL